MTSELDDLNDAMREIYAKLVKRGPPIIGAEPATEERWRESLSRELRGVLKLQLFESSSGAHLELLLALIACWRTLEVKGDMGGHTGPCDEE
jgi:hypothetical protein